jgi:UDP-glucuronate 4-epimerase
MALFKFTKAIIEGSTLEVFNYGKHKRDFTYIDDIVKGVICVLDSPSKSNEDWNGKNPDPGSSKFPWRIYNIGNNSPIELSDYIEAIEIKLNLNAKKEFLPLQPGDVPDTFADVSDLVNDLNYKPATTIKDGIGSFIDWYKEFYKVGG